MSNPAHRDQGRCPGRGDTCVESCEEREEWRKQPSRQRGLQEKIKKEHSVSGEPQAG